MKPYIFAISGYKKTGKTTLIEALIGKLTMLDYKVATVKHDGHDFEPDVPETDSYKHRKAGAFGTAVISGSRFMVTKEYAEKEDEILEKMLEDAFPEANVILLEGYKNKNYPKYICNFPEYVADVEQIIKEIIKGINSKNGGI